ncbi:hypothetical protein Droror1_Dr00008984 [Drosera rotundifolia]
MEGSDEATSPISINPNWSRSPFSFSSPPSPCASSSFLSSLLGRRPDCRRRRRLPHRLDPPSPPFPPLASSPLPIFKTLNPKKLPLGGKFRKISECELYRFKCSGRDIHRSWLSILELRNPKDVWVEASGLLVWCVLGIPLWVIILFLDLWSYSRCWLVAGVRVVRRC